MIRIPDSKLLTVDAVRSFSRRPSIFFWRRSFACLFLGLSFAVLLGGHSATCVAQDIPEIKFPTDGPSSKDYYKTCLQFYLHELELYQKKSADSPEVKKLVEPFIRYAAGLAAKRTVRYYKNPANNKEIEIAEAAMASGSEDPIFLSLATLFCEQQQEYERARGFGSLAIKRFDALKTYPRGIRFVLIMRFVKADIAGKRFDKNYAGFVHEFYDEALKDVPEFLAYGASLPNALRPTFDAFTEIYCLLGRDTDSVKVGRISVALTDYAFKEKADAWLVEMTHGWFAIKAAWSYREGGIGNQGERDWEKFGELMKMASKDCRAAHALRPDLPEAANALIAVARTGNDDKSTFYWFEQAIAAEVDNERAYSSLLFSLLPRWGGSHAQIIAFGQQCNKTKRYDTMAPYWLPISLLSIHNFDSVAWEKILSSPELVDEVLECCKKMLEDPEWSSPEREGDRLHILTMQVCVATKAERTMKAIELWEQLDGQKPDKSLLDYFDVDVMNKYDRSRAYAYAEFAEELENIRPLASDKARASIENKLELMSICSDLAERSVNPKSKLYFDHWVNLCQKELAFESGAWVDLEFDSNNDMWLVGGDWTFNKEDQSMHIKSRGMGAENFLISRCLFPGPKEIRAEVATTKRFTAVYHLGVSIGYGATTSYFWVDTTRQTIGIKNSLPYAWGGSFGPIDKRRNELHVKYWNPSSFELWVDGFRYFLRPKDDATIQYDSTVGIGMPRSFLTAGGGRVANVRVRKLVDPPLKRLDRLDKRLKYFSDLIEKNPKRYDYVFERGLERFYLNQVPEAIADFQLATKHLPDEHEYHHYLGDLMVRTGRVKEGLQQLEMSKQAFPASRFFGQSLLAYHLATVKDDQFRDIDRALEIVKELDKQSAPTVDSTLALAAVQIETGDLDKAIVSLKRVPALCRPNGDRTKMHRPTVSADAKSLAEKIIEKKQPSPFTLLSLKADSKASTQSVKKSGVELTTNDPFTYSPQTADFCFPVLESPLDGAITGYQGKQGSPLGKSKTKGEPKVVVLNYKVDKPHVVATNQPSIVVDLFGRNLKQGKTGTDNNIEVRLYHKGKVVAKKSKLAIPDDAAPYIRASFAKLKPGTKIDQIEIVARPGKKKKATFCLQEIRAAAIAPTVN